MKIASYFDNKVILIKNKIFSDNRGFFRETYNKKLFKSIGIKDTFVQDNHSLSKKKGTLRGMHFQTKPFEQSKILTVKKGKIFDVVLDIRKNSKYFGMHKSFILSDKNNYQIYVSKGFAHGFLTLEENTEIDYKVSNFYSPKHEKTIVWNDKDLNIKWNYSKVIISKKDRNNAYLFKDIIKIL